MDQDIHHFLTRVINPLITELSTVSQEGDSRTLRARSVGGSIRYSRVGGGDVALTKWLKSAREDIKNNSGDKDLEAVLDIFEEALIETYRFAYLTKNDEAVDILDDVIADVEDSYDLSIDNRIERLKEYVELSIDHDLDDRQGDIEFEVFSSGKYSYKILECINADVIELPKGMYQIRASYNGSSSIKMVDLTIDNSVSFSFGSEESDNEEDPGDPADEQGDAERSDRAEPAKSERNDAETQENRNILRSLASIPITAYNACVRLVTAAWGAAYSAAASVWTVVRRIASLIFTGVKYSLGLILISSLLLVFFFPGGSDMIMSGDIEEIPSTISSVVGLNTGFNTSKTELEIHRLINEERREKGLSALDFDRELREIARGHSRDMAARGVVSHESADGDEFQDRYEEAGYSCTVRHGLTVYQGAENVAMTYFRTSLENGEFHTNETDVAKGIVNQWMNSYGHRENIVVPYWEHQGIGVVKKENDAIYVTQNFC